MAVTNCFCSPSDSDIQGTIRTWWSGEERSVRMVSFYFYMATLHVLGWIYRELESTEFIPQITEPFINQKKVKHYFPADRLVMEKCSSNLKNSLLKASKWFWKCIKILQNTLESFIIIMQACTGIFGYLFLILIWTMFLRRKNCHLSTLMVYLAFFYRVGFNYTL